MGSSMSCVPQNSFHASGKSFIRTNSGRLFRKKNPQEGQEKSNSIINILSTVNLRKDITPKDLQMIQNITWDPPFDYNGGGWKKSIVNVKNYGRMIHSSKVRFRFLHCQEVHDCYLDLFESHLHFVSNNPGRLTYQGTLPLKELTLCKPQNSSCNDEQDTFAFQINGVSLNPIIVYCSNLEELERWVGLLTKQVAANGGMTSPPETKLWTRVKDGDTGLKGREELRNSVKNEPIYEWEGSHRDSLGLIVYITKVKLQHFPCQEQYERLLVMYPTTLIILSEEDGRLYYKGKLPLNMIIVTTPCQDVKPNSFTIEGQLINQIIVTCLDANEFTDWIDHFKLAHVPVQSPPLPVYDIIYTPTERESLAFDRLSVCNNHTTAESRRHSHSERGSYELPVQSFTDNLLSPGYTEPLCYVSSRPTSMDTQSSVGRSSRSSSMSSHTRPHSQTQLCSKVPASPIYNLPYTSVQKAPLTKSNSWSVPHTSVARVPFQRHSDMLALRRPPLSPLYDDPTTPRWAVDANHGITRQAVPVQCKQNEADVQILPPAFKLCTPPLRRRRRNSVQQEAERRIEAVSRLKLLTPPTAGTSQSKGGEKNLLSVSHQAQYEYSLDRSTYLQPAEPDDQEEEYDNVWDLGSDGVTHAPVRALTGMSAQQRWL